MHFAYSQAKQKHKSQQEQKNERRIIMGMESLSPENQAMADFLAGERAKSREAMEVQAVHARKSSQDQVKWQGAKDAAQRMVLR